MPEITDIELRSEAVQEIIGRPPHWMIRWGITIVFILLVSILFGCWFISYPDIVEGSAQITSTKPAVQVFSPASGKLKQVYFQDKRVVNEGDIVAELESPFSADQLSYLEDLLESIQQVKTTLQIPLFKPEMKLGAIDESHLNLKTAVEQFVQWTQNNYAAMQMNQLRFQLTQQKKLKSIVGNEKRIAEEELVSAHETYEVNKKLFEQGATARLEFLNEESVYRAKQSAFEQIKKQEVQTELTINSIEKQLFDLSFDLENRERELNDNMERYANQIRNEITFWKQGNALVAPSIGELHFAGNFVEQQFVNAGDLIFTVAPKGDSLYALAEIPASGYGKIAKGQTAFIRVMSFPYQEYGQLEAIVHDITPIANNETYRLILSLPHQMESTYHQTLTYSPNLAGSVRVITLERNLLQRIFSQLSKILER
jgi:multidrug efflux pump subunit AcrA (membrane-fusion protein)